MSAECDALRNDLDRISRQIAALDGKFIPIAEKPIIYAAIAKANSKAESALDKAVKLATALAELAATVLTVRGIADGASSKAGKALGIANAVAAGLEFVLGELRQMVTRARFDALENRLDVIEKGLDILTRLAQFLNRRIDELFRKVSYLEGLVRGLDNRITAIDRQVTSMIPVVNSNRERLNKLEPLIEGLDRRIRSLAVRVESLWERLMAAERQIAANKRQIALNGIAIVALEVLAAAAAIAISALQAQIVALGKALAALAAQVVAMRAIIFAAVRRIAVLEAKVQIALSTAREARIQARLAISLAEKGIRLANAAMAFARRVWGVAIDARSQAIEAKGMARQAMRKAEQALTKASQALIRADFAAQLARMARSIALDALRRTYELFVLVDALDKRVRSLAVRVTTIEEIIEMIRAVLDDILYYVAGDGQFQLNLSPCDASEEEQTIIQFGGEGVNGLYSSVGVIAQALQLLHDNTKCIGPDSGTAALPMFWEVKRGEVPQLVVIWSKLEGGSSTWSMTIPHPKEEITSDYPFVFPVYKKGGNMASVRLTDNSQIIVNAFSEDEAQRIIDYVATLIDPVFIPAEGLKMLYSKNVAAYAEVEIKCTYVKKFLGHRNTAPLWGRHIS